MSNTWILVADSSCAKIFQPNSEDDLVEVADLVHSESRLHAQDVTSDLPGSNAGGGGSRHGFEGQTSIKEHEAVNFAREIDVQLETGRNGGQYKRLIVAAAPAFLGILRQNISANNAKLVTHEVNKDLVKFSTAEIQEHLASELGLTHKA